MLNFNFIFTILNFNSFVFLVEKIEFRLDLGEDGRLVLALSLSLFRLSLKLLHLLLQLHVDHGGLTHRLLALLLLHLNFFLLTGL